jgi:hypothetical protein
MAENVKTSFYKSANKDKFKTDEVNAADFIARAGRLKMQQEFLDKAQAFTVKRLKCLDHHAAQGVSADYKEMECIRYKSGWL